MQGKKDQPKFAIIQNMLEPSVDSELSRDLNPSYLDARLVLALDICFDYQRHSAFEVYSLSSFQPGFKETNISINGALKRYPSHLRLARLIFN